MRSWESEPRQTPSASARIPRIAWTRQRSCRVGVKGRLIGAPRFRRHDHGAMAPRVIEGQGAGAGARLGGSARVSGRESAPGRSRPLRRRALFDVPGSPENLKSLAGMEQRDHISEVEQDTGRGTVGPRPTFLLAWIQPKRSRRRSNLPLKTWASSWSGSC
jgi:hypothetical protein